MKASVIALFLLCVGLAPVVAAQGQPSSDPLDPQGPVFRVWAVSGSSFYARPLWVGANVDVAVERGALTGRVGYGVQYSFWGPTTVNVVSARVGAHVRAGRFDLAALAGPALTWGTADEPRPVPDERFTTLGALAETSVFFEVGPGFGLGAVGHVSVNPAVSAFGGGPALRVKLAGTR